MNKQICRDPSSPQEPMTLSDRACDESDSGPVGVARLSASAAVLLGSFWSPGTALASQSSGQDSIFPYTLVAGKWDHGQTPAQTQSQSQESMCKTNERFI